MTKSKTYQDQQAELEDILRQIQQPDCDVDQATVLYEKGIKLVEEMRQQLSEAKNKINKLAPEKSQA